MRPVEHLKEYPKKTDKVVVWHTFVRSNAGNLWRMLQIDEIERKIKQFPTLPGIAIRLLNAFQKETPSLKEITEIISTDAPLALKVLKTVNSPFYGLKSKINSLGQAIAFLGLNSIKSLALSFSLVSALSSKKKPFFNYVQFWKDSIVGGLAAKIFAEQIGERQPESAFLVGLLQDIGSLLLAENFPQDYQSVGQLFQKTGFEIAAEENRIFGMDHAAVGSYLISKWGLPENFSIPIACHHTLPENAAPMSNRATAPIVALVQLSSLVIDLFRNHSAPVDFSALKDALIQTGLNRAVEPATMMAKISTLIHAIFPIFDLEVDAERHIEIIESSKAQLSDLAGNLITQIDTQKKCIAELARQAVIDGLTQLNNHRHFYSILKQEISRSARHGYPLALILADIDHFKSINDFFGHLVGDRILKAAADRLKSALRDSDHIARYGGEEFAILLPSTPLEKGILVAERLREAVERMKVPHDQKTISVTMSFGVAAIDGGREVGVENFIRAADEALYKAKAAGRNCCRAFFPSKQEEKEPPQVLVIDDEEVVLGTVSEMLRKLGYPTTTASDGDSAIAQSRRYASSLRVVLIDILMPGVPTQETISAIKSICPSSRVILSSGFTKEQIDPRLLEISDGYIGKPYTSSELKAQIETRVH